MLVEKHDMKWLAPGMKGKSETNRLVLSFAECLLCIHVSSLV